MKRNNREQEEKQKKKHSFWRWWWNFRKKVWIFRWRLLTALFATGMIFFILWFSKPMVIDTAKPEYHPEDSCSVFIYMCGSNLETQQGLGGKNIDELLAADIPDRVNIVLETGGSLKWRSHGISNRNLQRYLVKDHKLELVENLPDGSMGSTETFTDFLRWGKEKYPADRNVLIFWDHGGSAADGICYDERYGNDCLTRKELAEAFDSVELPKKLDFVIFDTCFMGSLETAAIMEGSAHYMIASQNVVPAGGLDYSFLAENFSANANEVFGPLLCDAFMDKCRSKKQDGSAQISFIDLAATSALISRFDDACGQLHARQKLVDRYMEKNNIESEKNVENSMISRAASEASAIRTAKVNVVDLVNFLDYSFGIDLALQQIRGGQAVDKFVLYSLHGDEVDNKGISIYFPVKYDRQQLQEYLDLCPIGNYKTILETIYANVPSDTLTFADKGSIDEDGGFSVRLTEKSRDYLAWVTCTVWKENEGGYNNYVLLGEDAVYDEDVVYGEDAVYVEDAVSGAYTDEVDAELRFDGLFKGEWYCFDGVPLLTKVIAKEKMACFTAPVRVNGEDTEYSFQYSKTKEGGMELRLGIVGSAYDEYGLPSRSFALLKKGDEVSVYTAVNAEGKDLRENEAFTITADRQLPAIEQLPEGRYRYQIVVTDIYENSFASNYCIFEVRGEGEKRTVTATEVLSTGR